MNDSMLSVVRHTKIPGTLLVRARLAGDIEQVFPAARVVENGGSRRVLGIDYSSFKASVPEPKHHNAYFKVWDVLH